MESTSSHNYKRYNRGERKLINEPNFTGGMQYTDNPLAEGISKLLVNYIQKDYGARIRPRGGWKPLTPPTLLGNSLGETYIHHTGTTFIEDTITNDVFLRRYALVLGLPNAGTNYGSLTNSKVLVEEPSNSTDPNTFKVASLKSGSTAYQIRHNNNKTLKKIHEMPVTDVSPTGIAGTLNGNTYVLTDSGIGRLHVYYNSTTKVYTHDVKMVTPKTVTPMQAVNYGYNMLLSAPYTFENVAGANFSPQGILPYDVDTGDIKLQAKVGEKINF